MNSIYRFLCFESFVDIVQTNCLTFVKPEMWEDPYESYILRILKRPDGMEQIKKCINETGIQRLPDLQFLSMIGTHYYGQCWTKTPESDALWRIYSFNNKSIRVEICSDDIDKLKCDNLKVIHGPVVYEKDLDLKIELAKVFEDNQINALNVFLTKRSAFSHENEYRLMIFDIGDTSSPIRQVKFEDVTNFIKSVTLHPLAPSWFDKTLEEYCTKNGLKYSGKSSLYSFR